MSDERRRVLDLLAQGKITVDEADQLLRALTDQPLRNDGSEAAPSGPVTRPRFLRIHVHKPAQEGRDAKNVNIRVPMAIIRGGMRLGMMVPGFQDRMHARLKVNGMEMDFTKLDPAAIESLLNDMGEINIDDEGSGERVRITTE
jgi:hypothetical protein